MENVSFISLGTRRAGIGVILPDRSDRKETYVYILGEHHSSVATSCPSARWLHGAHRGALR
jgi:hypothetical protein